MLRKKEGNRLIKPLYLSTLIFKIPYEDNPNLVFRGISYRPGIAIMRYTNKFGRPSIKICASTVNMRFSARNLLQFAQRTGAQNTTFAFIDAPPKDHKRLKISLSLGYLHENLHEAYSDFKKWMNGELTEIPLNSVSFYQPFIDDEHGKKRWTFYDLRHRPGIYFIKEDEIIVRVGLTHALHDRPRNYFYPSRSEKGRSHISYYEQFISKQHVYELGVVPFPLQDFSSWKQMTMFLKKMETQIISTIKPRNNHLDNPLYQAVPQEEEDYF